MKKYLIVKMMNNKVNNKIIQGSKLVSKKSLIYKLIISNVLMFFLSNQIIIPAKAVETDSVVVQVDMTDATKVSGSTLTNTASGKLSDLTIFNNLTTSSDGFFFNNSASYLTGNLGATTNMKKIIIEMNLKLVDDGNIDNSSGSMIFGFGTNSGSYVPYNIYHHSGFIGFNTFNSELYGIPVPDITNFHQYKFVMFRGSESYTLQEIWLDGVKQSLAYQTKSPLNGTSENNGNRKFTTSGGYSNGDFTVMRHPLGSTWFARGYMKDLKVTTTTVEAAPTNSLAPTITGTKSVGETLNSSTGSWSGSPTSYSYQWKRASSAAGSYSDIPDANTSSYVLTTDDVGKYIKVGVAATNAGGSSTQTLSSATSAISASAPNSPTINSITASDGKLTINYTAGSNGGSSITNYKYSTDGINYQAFSPADTTSPLEITKISTDGITSLINGTIYPITIKAVNIINDSVPSNSVNGTPASSPSSPIGLTAIAGSNSVSLNWSAGSNGGSAITDYIIEYSTDNSTWTTFSDGTSTSTTATVTGLTNGTLYYFRVSAVNAVNTGSATSSLSSTPAASSGGGSSSSTPTPTPSPSESPTRTSSPRPTPTSTPIQNQITQNPLLQNPAPQSGSINNPAPLVKKIIEEIIEPLRPKIVNLFTPSNGQTSAPSNSENTQTPNVSSFNNQQALDLTTGTQVKKVVDLPSLVLVNDLPEPSKVVIVDNTTAQIVTPNGGLLNVVSKERESSLPVDNQGRVQMVKNYNVETEGKGLAPNSEFAVYLFSEPTLIGVGKTNANGEYFASFKVDENLPIGDHTLQVNGILPDGKTSSISMPVVLVDSIITAQNQAMPKTILIDDNPIETATNSLYFIIAIFIALIIFMLFGGSKLLFAAFKRNNKLD